MLIRILPSFLNRSALIASQTLITTGNQWVQKGKNKLSRWYDFIFVIVKYWEKICALLQGRKQEFISACFPVSSYSAGI